MVEDTGTDTDEAVDIVSRRASVIDCLIDGPKYNRDIRDALEVSRSTAYKATSELETLQLVRRGDDGHELTVFGQLLYDEYRRFRDRVDDVCRAGGLLAVLPPDVKIPFDVVEDAEISLSKRHAPNEPVREIERLVEAASSVKGTAPVVLPRYVELFSRQVMSGELEAELVWERPVFEYLITDYEEDFTAALEKDDLRGWVTDAELPYGLLVVEEPTQEIAVVVYDDTGDIEGVLINHSDRAYAWGRDRWDEYLSSATRPVSDMER